MKSTYMEIANALDKLSKCYGMLAQKDLSKESNECEIIATKKVTIGKVREVLACKSKSGKTSEVKELLGKFGVNKLSQIKEEDFPALMIEAEKL